MPQDSCLLDLDSHGNSVKERKGEARVTSECLWHRTNVKSPRNGVLTLEMKQKELCRKNSAMMNFGS